MKAVSDSHGNLLKPKEVSIVGYAADLIKEKHKEQYIHKIHKSNKGTTPGFH